MPDLRSFDVNRLGIEPTDIGLDSTIEAARSVVRPRDKSGIVVKFKVKISHAALLRLVDETGRAVPVGSSARLRGGSAAAPVGYDGEAYIEDLKPQNNMVEVARPDGRRCKVGFDYKPVNGEIPVIGPLRCVEPRP